MVFVPATPGSELAKRFKQTINNSGIHIKVIEKSGKSLGEILRTSDPRKMRKCLRTDCPVCTSNGKGNCKILDINYRMTCECEDSYIGTTTRGAYTRGKEHIEDLNLRKDSSDMWQHCKEKHSGELKKFKMDIIESFKRDPLLRQVSEATRISRADKTKLINKKEEICSTRTS